MKRTLKANTPWLAAIWLCCGGAIVAGDGATALQEENQKSKESVEEIIEQVIKDAKSGGDQEISVNVETIVVKDGDDEEGKKQVKGQVVIMKDGKKQVIDLKDLNGKGHRAIILDGDKMKEMELDLKDMKFDVLKDGAAVRIRSAGEAAAKAMPAFRIGVHCEPVSAALRAHVDVPETAVIVEEVLEDSPAAKAGLEVHDILVKAGDKSIESLEGLVKRIQESKGEPLSFAIIRKGKETTLAVTPEKRKATEVSRVIRKQLMNVGDKGKFTFDFDIDKVVDGKHGEFVIEAMRPGMVIDGSHDIEKIMKMIPNMGKDKAVYYRWKAAGRDAKAKAKNVRVRVEEKAEAHEHEEEHEAHEHDGDEEDDDDDDEDDELHERLEELTKEINRLKSAIKKLKSRRR